MRRIDDLLNNTNIYIFTVVSLVILRILIAAFSGYHGTDMQGQLLASRGLLSGRFLYTEVQPAGLQFGYPPPHAYLQAFFLLLFGDTVLPAKMPAILGDIGVSVMLFLLGRERDELFGRKLSLAYLIFPLSILSSDVIGLFDSFALFLMLCGIYFIERERDLLSSVFLGFGILYKFFPFLALFPISLGYIKREKYSRLILLFLVIILLGLAVFAPFLLTDRDVTLRVSSQTAVKKPDSFSLFRVIPVENEFLPFVFQVLGVLALYFMMMRWNLFQENYFTRISLFLALFLMLNKNIYPHYFLWVFPFMAICCLKFHKDIELILIMLVNTGILGIYWIRLGQYVNSGPVLPLLFQLFNWGVILWAVFREHRFQHKGKTSPGGPSWFS